MMHCNKNNSQSPVLIINNMPLNIIEKKHKPTLLRQIQANSSLPDPRVQLIKLNSNKMYYFYYYYFPLPQKGPLYLAMFIHIRPSSGLSHSLWKLFKNFYDQREKICFSNTSIMIYFQMAGWLSKWGQNMIYLTSNPEFISQHLAIDNNSTRLTKLYSELSDLYQSMRKTSGSNSPSTALAFPPQLFCSWICLGTLAANLLY